MFTFYRKCCILKLVREKPQLSGTKTGGEHGNKTDRDIPRSAEVLDRSQAEIPPGRQVRGREEVRRRRLRMGDRKAREHPACRGVDGAQAGIVRKSLTSPSSSPRTAQGGKDDAQRETEGKEEQDPKAPRSQSGHCNRDHKQHAGRGGGTDECRPKRRDPSDHRVNRKTAIKR